MTQLSDFLDETLYPAMYDELSNVFPEMSFKKKSTGGGWRSHLKLDGSATSRSDKTVVNARIPHRAYEQGGESVSLIDLYMKKNGIDTFIKAVEEIAGKLGKQLPQMENSAEYDAYLRKVEELEKAASTMQASLRTEAGKAVLSYLTDVRGYGEDFIEWAGFGYISPETAARIRPLFSYKGNDGQERNHFNGAIGTSYQLAIPYRSGGRLRGFVFRCIDESLLTKDGKRMGKYVDAFISGKDSKNYHLFGLSGLRLTQARDITIVEGELDALRAQFSGVENVVAVSGNNLSAEALEEVKRKGVRRVTMLLDRDDSESGRRATREKVKRAVSTIKFSGLEPFVATFEEGDGKMDVDLYLRDHTGEDLKTLIRRADFGALAIFDKILHDAIDRDEGLDEATPKNIDEMKAQAYELANDRNLCSGTERDLVIERLSDVLTKVMGVEVSKETVEEEADEAVRDIDERRKVREYASTFREASRMASEGDVAGAMELISKKEKEIGAAGRERDFARDMALPTEESIMEEFAEAPTGVETSLTFGQGNSEQRFIIPSGALTFICGQPSHGKSRLLENLALQIAKDADDETVLYYSYEEDARSVKMQLMNIYAAMRLSQNNMNTLKSYYKNRSTEYFSRDFKEHHFTQFKQKEKDFLRLLKSGRLRVFHRNLDGTELTEHIRYFHRNTRVKAVFIDYVQLIHKKGSRLQRKDEIKEICEELMEVAVETGLPIVLAAQLNRSTKSPLEMTVQNIAEASDIEQSANVVMLIWNSVVPPLPESTAYYTGKDPKRLTDEAKRLEGMGFHIGQKQNGKIYAILSKNRGGERNIDTVLDFDGNTGVISSPVTLEPSLPFGEGKRGPEGF